jgi:glycine dehydrogenase subunit 1
MLETVGVASVDELFAAVPSGLMLTRPLRLPPGLSEPELMDVMTGLAAANKSVSEYVSFLGGGCVEHYIPAAVDHLAARGDFYTAYTPYQAEASQGTLQAIFEYQSMFCELTGMEVSNASHYDGATAAAEAALMGIDLVSAGTAKTKGSRVPASAEKTSGHRRRVVATGGLAPDTVAVLRTYLAYANAELAIAPLKGGSCDPADLKAMLGESATCVIAQSPNFFGCIEDMAALVGAAHGRGAFFVAVCDPLSLALLEAPGKFGADIAVGDGQVLGNELSLGGSSFGFMATRMEFVRRLPGRMVGETVDARGTRAFVLTLQTREQHIRREKATSNICTNEALCALRAVIHLSLLGKEGFRHVADLCLQKAHYAADLLGKLPGYGLPFARPFFNEFVLSCPRPVSDTNKALLGKGIIGGLDLSGILKDVKNPMLLTLTEFHSKDDIDRLAEILSRVAVPKSV